MAALTSSSSSSSLTLNNHFLHIPTTTSASSSCLLKPFGSISLSFYQKNKKDKQKNRISVSVSVSVPSTKSFDDLVGPSKFKGGPSVLERPRPNFDPSQFEPSTQVQHGGDIGRVRDRRGPGSGDSYRVLLVDDVRHTEDLVAKVLPQTVPVVTPDGARELFYVSRKDGLAVVIVTVKEHAEFYAQMMVRGGLRSTIEPDSSIL